MAAIALPAIGCPLWIRATDLEALAAIPTEPAAADVIHCHAIVVFEMAAAGTQIDALATWLVASDDATIGGGSLGTLMLVVDIVNVAAANSRSTHAEQHLADSRLRDHDLP